MDIHSFKPASDVVLFNLFLKLIFVSYELPATDQLGKSQLNFVGINQGWSQISAIIFTFGESKHIHPTHWSIIVLSNLPKWNPVFSLQG